MICLCNVALTESGHVDTLNKTLLRKSDILPAAYFQMFYDQNCKNLGTIKNEGSFDVLVLYLLYINDNSITKKNEIAIKHSIIPKL